MIQTYRALIKVNSPLDDWKDVVLLSDHIAEVEQWKRIIVTHVDVIAEKDEQIAYNQGCYDDASGEWRLEEQDLRKMIAEKDARIKELTEALERIAKDTGNRPGQGRWGYYCNRLYDLHLLAQATLAEHREGVDDTIKQT